MVVEFPILALISNLLPIELMRTGGTVILTGRLLAVGQVRGNKVKGVALRYIFVHIKQDGRWQLAAQQATPILAK